MISQAVIPAIELGFIITSAYIDYEHLIDNDFIEDHKSRVILRGIFGLTLLYIDLKFATGYALFHLAIFDQVLNKMRGKSFWHLGHTADFDKFFRKRPILYKITFFVALSLAPLSNALPELNPIVFELIKSII